MVLSRRSFAGGVIALPFLTAFARSAAAKEPSLRDQADAVRQASDLPALAVIAGHNGTVLDEAAVGVRARGAGAAVTPLDRWHIGSCAKAMTATLVAKLVEGGTMSWNSPLTELLGPVPAMHPETSRITLYQLVTMQSGLPENPVGGLSVGQLKRGLLEIQSKAADDRSRRLVAMQRVISTAPKKAPGTAFAYSNTNYILLGAILERAADVPFDELIAREIFAPLKITDFGFGAPGSKDALDQPLGHEPRANGAPIAPQSPDADLPSFLRPAGGINMALADWMRFVADHAAGEAGAGALLTAETYKLLHTTPDTRSPYAGGWGVSMSKGRRVLSHVGNNTRFTAMVHAYPDSGHAFLYASNDGRDDASVKAFLKVQAGLAAKFVPDIAVP